MRWEFLAFLVMNISFGFRIWTTKLPLRGKNGWKLFLKFFKPNPAESTLNPYSKLILLSNKIRSECWKLIFLTGRVDSGKLKAPILILTRLSDNFRLKSPKIRWDSTSLTEIRPDLKASLRRSRKLEFSKCQEKLSGFKKNLLRAELVSKKFLSWERLSICRRNKSAKSIRTC